MFRENETQKAKEVRLQLQGYLLTKTDALTTGMIIKSIPIGWWDVKELKDYDGIIKKALAVKAIHDRSIRMNFLVDAGIK